MYIRAWIPAWAAQRDSFNNLIPLPKLDDGNSLWFVGHDDPARLHDEALDHLVADAKRDGQLTSGCESDDFHLYLEYRGYTTFATAEPDNYIADIDVEGTSDVTTH